ncbi:ABC transporter ATP-binding protein [Mucilaginibacter sp. ZT4R22]|uniref:ABC transporter ATP-binding protein n=1 Tax=Mucilaginibacter pankratovii TaxID=2772110 RepID=A0ABR7WRL1_9SPHI|nr:ABC transporter ATP-binding protein [Mucilaginibacter pankratovii]MBD1364881.1 ABC transporter ATP-binding protein [Mucilaginibacter pankratovii]
MKQILKSIFLILIQQEKSKLFKLIVFDVLIALLDIAFLALLLVIINFYTQVSGANRLAFLPVWLGDNNSLKLIGLFLLLFACKNALGFFGQRAQHHFFYRVASRLSARNIRNYLRGGYLQFVHTNSSVQTRRISNQPIEFSHYLLTNFQQLVSQTLLITFTVAAILFYHPSLFLIMLLLLLPPVGLLGRYTRKRQAILRYQTKTASAKTIQHLNESLSGYVESNMYDKDDFFSSRYLSYQQQLNNTIAAQQTWQSLPGRLMEVFAVLGFLILVAINKYITNAPGIGILTIGIFMAAAYKVIPGIVKIMNSTGQMKTYAFILEDLVAGNEIKRAEPCEKAKTIRQVKFERISFTYQDRLVLDDLSFEIASGDMMGISANSGKGKTTIINLLLGFLKYDKGSISINNSIADSESLQAYRKNISLVKQQPFFIHDSIQRNITLNDSTADQAKLDYAVEFCGLDELLAKYPEGIDHMITENGKNISGGQRQRLMLARALYHDFDLLILDEPFSEMDSKGEQEILAKLNQLAKEGKMIILITHNKASLGFCNKVISLEGAYA